MVLKGQLLSPPIGWPDQAYDQLVTKMDAVDKDISSFLKQNIIQKLILESEHWALLPTELIKIMVEHFNLGSRPHRAFESLVRQLAATLQVSVQGFQSALVAPQLSCGRGVG